MTKLTKQFIDGQKGKLEKEKKQLEKELSFSAKKNMKSKGDWITKYPNFNSGKLESEPDETEEYENLLSVVQTLEKEVKKIEKALERIKKGTYGICEKCKKSIPKGRLMAYPQANCCLKCQ